MIARSELPMAEAVAGAARALRPLLQAAPPAAALVPATGPEDLLAALQGLRELPLAELVPPELAQPLFLAEHRGRPLLLAPAPPQPWAAGAGPALLFLFRLLSALEVERVVLASACAGLDPRLAPGTVCVARDHLDLSGTGLLRRPPGEEGPWSLFPDLTAAHDPRLRAEAAAAAKTAGLELPEVVVAAVPGPALPTPAETRFYRLAGAEALAMSGPQEVVAAVQAGLAAVLLLAVTQRLDPEAPAPADLEAMVAAAERAAPGLAGLALTLSGGPP